MGKSLSMDLRSRALAAVNEEMSCRAAARRFEVAAATVIRWHDQCRITGSYAAKPQGADTRSRRIEAHRDTALVLHDARYGITRKKPGHAAEQDRPDVLSARETWFDDQFDSTPSSWCSSTRPGPRPT